MRLMPAFAAGLERSGKPVRQHALVKFIVLPIRKHKEALQLPRDIQPAMFEYHLFYSYI